MTNHGGALRGFAAGLLVLGFATPARVLWQGQAAPWWTPFALWGLAILALLLAARRGGTDASGGMGP